MLNTSRLLALLVLTAAVTGCATHPGWTESKSDRDLGVVRVSYEFPEFREPALSDTQANRVALSRCEGWGYDAAEPIQGQLRQCSNMHNGDCDQWKVTREFQCTRSVAQANLVAR